MTAIADKIRAILGITGNMGLDAMASNLQEVNDEIGDQAALITSIVGELQGKGVGGGSTSSIPTEIKAGNTPVIMSSTQAYTSTSTSMVASGIEVTVPRTGTYRFKFACSRTNTSGTWNAQLYKNGSPVSGATATWNQYQGTCSADISCNEGDLIEIYCQARGSTYRIVVTTLVGCIDWETGL